MTTAAGDKALSERLNAILNNQRSAFRAEGEVELASRIDRIDRCIALLVDNHEAICQAVNEDFGCRSAFSTKMMDITNSIGSLKFVKKNLKKWMKPERRKAMLPMNFLGASATVHFQPKGVVGIMTPWNVPVNMMFSPLADVLGAGNRAMIKPSEFTPRTSECMKELFARYFEPSEVTVITGGPEVGAAFSALPFDHLIFTGATSIGKHILRAAAENLVPVTLELGGKSPVVISEQCDIYKVAETLISSKAMNGGQLCISPDYCFIPEGHLEAFIRHCQSVIAEQFPSIQDNPDFVSCINERHYQRIASYLDEAEAAGTRIVALSPAGEERSSAEAHKIALHLVVNPSDDLACMQEEIFGPLMCIKTYRDIEQVINFINDREKPLALYYFGDDKEEQDEVLNRTSSGGVSINSVGMHVGCDDLPFGGIGKSGMGNYRGRDGFRTFSHTRAVYKDGWLNIAKLAGTLPPYGEKLAKMLDSQIKK
ncbi:coniferyl aldehyde dehydrogenase [Parahaliea sp. F7430]|uniref:Aldehyde dehydrogenase n=1 Tax=Sediminihaliea albiluteola TaxID=2758564 RepID=A0A7W2TWH1_9GAMM|nr:coniferyl aldehyde dehydrogenase [Sediminihaliea albiluteola]MBA6413236.1 coniferyl aldehyde dehydrogenase [Sediminihaliea albiluteola]